MTKTNKIVRGSDVISPVATAVWLVDNTCLTFKQIGDFCGLDEMEIKSIADGLLASNIIPLNPIKTGSLTQQEIHDREKDGKPLKNAFTILKGVNIKIQKQKKYIPMVQKRSRPEAVLWLITYAPDLFDSQIIRLLRTTKNMVQKMRDKTYEGYEDLTPKDPVIVGFCSQKDLDFEIEKAKKKRLNNEDTIETKQTKPRKKANKKKGK